MALNDLEFVFSLNLNPVNQGVGGPIALARIGIAGEEPREMEQNLARFPVFARKEIAERQYVAFAFGPVVDGKNRFADQEAGSAIHFADDDRVTRAVPAGIGGRDISEPE